VCELGATLPRRLRVIEDLSATPFSQEELLSIDAGLHTDRERAAPATMSAMTPEHLWYRKSSEWTYEEEWRFTRLERKARPPRKAIQTREGSRSRTQQLPPTHPSVDAPSTRNRLDPTGEERQSAET